MWPLLQKPQCLLLWEQGSDPVLYSCWKMSSQEPVVINNTSLDALWSRFSRVWGSCPLWWRCNEVWTQQPVELDFILASLVAEQAALSMPYWRARWNVPSLLSASQCSTQKTAKTPTWCKYTSQVWCYWNHRIIFIGKDPKIKESNHKASTAKFTAKPYP